MFADFFAGNRENMEGTRPFRAVSEQHGREETGNLESMEGAHPFGAVPEQHEGEKAGDHERNPSRDIVGRSSNKKK